METRMILPFIQATKNVFGTMLKTAVTFGQPSVKASHEPCDGVSAIIGFTGSVSGSIVLSIPLAVAGTLIKRFIGAEVTPDHPDFADAVGELANMIAGGAKASFNRDDVAIACPSVVMGSQHQVFQRKDQPIIVIPCSCDGGSFVTEVSLKDFKAAVAKPAIARAS